MFTKVLLRVSLAVCQFCQNSILLLTEFSNIIFFTFYWASGESLVLISTHTHTLTHGHTHEKKTSQSCF